jgi:hypothetical protein
VPDLGALTLGILAAALAAGAIFLAGRWLPPLRGGAVAVGLGYAAGHAVLLGWPAFPPPEKSDWVPWIGLGIAACGLVEPWIGSAARRSWLPRLAAPAIVPWLLLRGAGDWGVPAVGCFSIALVAHAASVEALGARRKGASLPLALWVGAAGASGVLLLSGSLKLAELAGLVAACAAAPLVLGWCRVLHPLAGGAPAAVATLIAAIVATGWIYDVPLVAGALAVAAPSAAWLGEAPAIRRLSPRKSALARLAITLLCALAAVAVAWQASPPYE